MTRVQISAGACYRCIRYSVKKQECICPKFWKKRFKQKGKIEKNREVVFKFESRRVLVLNRINFYMGEVVGFGF